MFHACRIKSSPRAISFASVSPRAAHIVTPDFINYAAGVSSGYTSFCTAASGMGRMDSFGIYNPDNGERGGHVCDAKDLGQQKSP